MATFAIKRHDKNYLLVYPDKCPICHRLIVTPAVQVSTFNGGRAEVVFQCPNPECKRLFFAYYVPVFGERVSAHKIFPTEPSDDEIPDAIREISPTFVDIYIQALEAIEGGLDQVGGPGLRKAFEFLIKDYAKSKAVNEGKHEEIDKLFAGTVVNKYIEDRRVVDVSKRALWIGNDETHYLRKWTEHDVNDLLALISLTIRWIEIEKLSSDYLAQLPEDEEAKGND